MVETLDFTTDVKKQHTVPRFLLSNFSSYGKRGKIQKIYTYDKYAGRYYLQSVYDATTRNSFYNFKSYPDQYSLEPILGKIENEAAIIIRKIIETESIRDLSHEERRDLAVFVLVQKFRSYNQLQMIKGMVKDIEERWKLEGGDQEWLNEFNSVSIEDFFLEMILKSTNYIDHLLNKKWILYKAEEGSFYISDNPVTWYNDIDTGVVGNLGLEVLGIQIYLPISSNFFSGICMPILNRKNDNCTESCKRKYKSY